MGLNHSDMYTCHAAAARADSVFVVDALPVGQVPGAELLTSYPMEAGELRSNRLAMDWERLIPGTFGAGGRFGTKQDAQDLARTFLQDVRGGQSRGAARALLGPGGKHVLKLPVLPRAGRSEKRGQPAVRAPA